MAGIEPARSVRCQISLQMHGARVAIADSTTAAAPDEARARPGAPRIRLRRWMVLFAVGVLLTAALVSVASVDGDSGTDLAGLLRSVGTDFAALRWQYAMIVLALGALHYLATAVAARAAAGVPLPFGETLLVQLAAAAANRLTPAGLGASAVNARFFTRRGLSTPASLAAVAALGVLGAVADLIVLTTVVVAGRWLGLAGGPHEIDLLASHVSSLLAPIRSPLFCVIAAVLATGIAALVRVRARRSHAKTMTQVWTPLRRLLQRPRSFATLLAASGLTTLILGFAFVASTSMVPGPRPTASVGALLIAFMIGAAAGSAVPVPAGLGSTEAALVAVLVGAQVPAGHAVQEVLIFRALTFWMPAIVGVLATRHLERRNAL